MEKDAKEKQLKELQSEYPDQIFKLSKYGGVYLCEHKNVKYFCVDCGGSQICSHKKQKSSCGECKKMSRPIKKRKFE